MTPKVFPVFRVSSHVSTLSELAHILVVDDQPLVRRTIRSMLADKTGWKLSEAENGKVALDLTKQNPPDVVLLDIVMPVMNGMEAAYEIKKIAPDTKIVFISSHYTEEQASSLKHLFGADCFVPKSEMGRTLIPTIKQVLEA